jgi:hypothetical protein
MSKIITDTKIYNPGKPRSRRPLIFSMPSGADPREEKLKKKVLGFISVHLPLPEIPGTFFRNHALNVRMALTPALETEKYLINIKSGAAELGYSRRYRKICS